MKNFRIDAFLITADAAIVLLAPPLAGFAATLLLAARWSRRIDREERAVQLVGADPSAVNL